jgi:hypothetical protein
MGPVSARYVIRINGNLGATLLAAFPAMAWQLQGQETVLTGVLTRPGSTACWLTSRRSALSCSRSGSSAPRRDRQNAVIPAHHENPQGRCDNQLTEEVMLT